VVATGFGDFHRIRRMSAADDAAKRDAHLIERTLTSEVVHAGIFFDVKRDSVALPGGGEALREYILHPGAVMVVPIADDGRLVMERQYRHAVGRVLLEFPAGKLDPGEAALDCGVRELAEETGYRASEWARAGILHNAVGYSNEGIEIWFARGLTAGAVSPDVGEHIEVVLVDEDELDRAVHAGDVTDAKTLVGLMWLKNWRAGRWPLQWSSAR
jgi:ADP-ribose pyrophosphatase